MISYATTVEDKIPKMNSSKTSYTEFVYSDEYLSDWEIYDYQDCPPIELTETRSNSMSMDIESHLSTEDLTDDSDYISSKMSQSDLNESLTISEWMENCLDILGIECDSNLHDITDDSLQSSLNYDNFIDDFNDPSELQVESTCSKHENPAVVYCTTCKDFLCGHCRFNHKIGHELKILESTIDMLQGRKDYFKHNLKERSHQLAEATEYQNDVTQKRHLVRELLSHKRAALLRNVELQFEKINSQLELVYNQEIHMTNRRIESLSHALAEDHRQLQEVQNLLNDFQNEEITKDSKNNGNVMDNKEVKLGFSEQHFSLDKDIMNIESMEPNQDYLTLTFDLDLTSNIHLHKQYFILDQDGERSSHFGQFSTACVTSNGLKTCLATRGTVKNSFKTRGRQGMSHMASGIQATPGGGFLITDIGKDTVNLYDEKGNKKLNLNIVPQDEPTSACQMADGTFLIATKDGLRLLNQNGHSIRNVEPSIESPRGIAVTPSGDIIVTNQESTGSLIHILSGDNFRCKHTIIGGSRAPLFTKAWYVTTDNENNIVITDSSEHTVKILSPNGMLMYEFGGQGCNPGEFFYPAGVCVDAYGHILVADMGNNRIQMFSKTGEFLTVILNSDNGLKTPMDIDLHSDLHSNHDLVILQGNGEVKIVQYLY